MKENTLHKILTAMAITTIMAGMTAAQTANKTKNQLVGKGAGKLNFTANFGYIYNFSSKWDNPIIGDGKANSRLGYGARFGWAHHSGFGLSGDYLGFTSRWSDGKDYYSPYHIFTYHILAVTPSYRFSFGGDKNWGLKIGLGVGLSLADVTWGTNIQTAICSVDSGDSTDTSKCSGGSTKNATGFTLLPEIALEYDNGMLHLDINSRYIHGLANVKYDGSQGAGDQLQKSGPLAVFVGGGLGVNF